MKWIGRVINGEIKYYRPIERQNYIRTMEGRYSAIKAGKRVSRSKRIFSFFNTLAYRQH